MGKTIQVTYEAQYMLYARFAYSSPLMMIFYGSIGRYSH